MKRGFTLIEILITIAILMLLIGIAAYSMSRVGESGRERDTTVTLGNLKNMVAELEATAGLRGRQPPHLWVNGTATAPGTALDAWKDANPTDATAPEPDAVIAPAAFDDATRFDSDAVRNTQLMMILIAQAPKNRTAMSSLPGGSVAKFTDITATTGFDESKEVGVPLDSWGNPIIFVPAGGLCGNATVEMLTGGKKVVANPTGANEIAPIRSTDARPFWASAGPDGSFARADDNLYSF